MQLADMPLALICRPWFGVVLAAAGPGGRVPIGALPSTGHRHSSDHPLRSGDGHPFRGDQETDDHAQHAPTTSPTRTTTTRPKRSCSAWTPTTSYTLPSCS